MSIKLKKTIAAIAAFAIVATAVGLAPVFRGMRVAADGESGSVSSDEEKPGESEEGGNDSTTASSSEGGEGGNDSTTASSSEGGEGGNDSTTASSSEGGEGGNDSTTASSSDEATTTTTTTTAPEETTVPDSVGGDNEELPPADDDVAPPANDNNNNNAVTDKPVYSPSGTSSDTSSSTASAPSSPSTGTAGETTVSGAAQITATRNPILTVNAADTSVSTEMVTAFVKNNAAKTMTLSYSSTLKIAVDKEDISDAEAANLNFSISTKNFLTQDVLLKNKALNNATKIVQLDFEGEGKLEGVDKVTIKSRVGTKFAGKEVTVYEYADGKLVKLGTCKIGGSGLVNFKTDHFGQFVIAVE